MTRGAAHRAESPEKTTATPRKAPASTRSTRHTSPAKSTRRSASPTKSRRSASPTKSSATPSKVRRKLQKTSIAPPEELQPVNEQDGSEDGTDESESAAAEGKVDASAETNGSRGRVRRKRSYEEVAEEGAEPKSVSKHVRKRSRESIGEVEDKLEAPAEGEEMVVPKDVQDIKDSRTEEDMDNTGYNAVDKVNDPALTPPPEPENAGKGPISAANGDLESTSAPTETPSKIKATDSARTSPGTKRTREEFTKDDEPDVILAPTEPAKVAVTDDSVNNTIGTDVVQDVKEPESKRTREEITTKTSAEVTQIEAPELSSKRSEVCRNWRSVRTLLIVNRYSLAAASPTHPPNLPSVH